MTNFPNTLSEEKEFEKIRPLEMIGVKDSQQSLLNIRLRLLSEGSPKIGSDNVQIFVEVKMSQIIINFYMQPIMRLLDFTLSQLLFALTSPERTINPEGDEVSGELVQE